MKKYGFLFLLVAAGIIFSSFSSSSKLKTSIRKGCLKINGHAIPEYWTLKSFTDILGQADSTRDGANKTHTYHRKGIVLFEPMADKTPLGSVSEIQFYFYGGELNNVTPLGTYTGKFKVDKLKVSHQLTYSELKLKLKDWKETDSFIPHNHRLSKQGIYIYFQFNDDDSRLVKMSVGKE